MSTISWTLPEELLLALRLTPEAASGELRLAAAVKLYELGRLSSGSAAELAGIPKVVFLSKLADFGVPSFKMTEEELREDAERA